MLQSELGLIQRVLTDELMHTILSHLGPYSLGRVACVCQQWRQFAEVGTGISSLGVLLGALLALSSN
jgi:hypothetical protein